ncbi:MAG: hypothetical protein ACRYGM_06535 [Janthinobacterium lividum]
MTRTLCLLLALAASACANPNAPVAAPSGIRAESGGGEQQLRQVRGQNVGVGGVLKTTRFE